MDHAQPTNGEQSTSAMKSQNIGTEPDVVASNEQTTANPEVALDPLEERTDMEQLKATVEQLNAVIEKITTSQDQAKIDAETAHEQATNKITQLTVALDEAKIKTEEQVQAALETERAKTEKRIDAAVGEATSISPRNLVVCIDGTSNQFGPNNTNVIELYHLLDKDDNQLTFYNSGIGTYATPSWKSWAYRKQQLDHKLDLAIAWNFERIVQIAYQWLSEQYHDGDRIFLFGFSRGAYQVRCLSAMIHRVGLIHRGNEAQIAFAYQLYASTGKVHDGKELKKHFFKAFRFVWPSFMRRPGSAVEMPQQHNDFGDMPERDADFVMDDNLNFTNGKTPRNEQTLENPTYMARRFKETFSREVRVHFVGAWDTVSSVGVVRDKTLPGTTDGMKHVNFFRHALALDERRVKFLPEYAYEGSSLPCGQHEKVFELKDRSDSLAHTKEVWFAGTHSDMGGGNVPNADMDLSTPSLRWMSYQAATVGLRVKPITGVWELKAPITVTMHESLSWYWWPFEMMPWLRLTYHDEKSSTMRPHRGMGRHICEGQTIHTSLLHDKRTEKVIFESRSSQSRLKRIISIFHRDNAPEKRYVPKASLKRLGRDDLRTWSEFYDATGDTTTLLALVERDLNDLASEVVHDIRAARPLDTPYLLRQFVSLASSVDGARALRDFTDSYTDFPRNVIDSVLPVDARNHISRIAKEWVLKQNPKYQRNTVSSIAYTPNHKRAAVVRSLGDTIALCEVSPDQRPLKAVQTLKGHTDAIVTLAFSPDGKIVGSGSCDHIVRVWNVGDSDYAECFVLEGHAAAVGSVAFSPNGEFMASGSVNGTIITWRIYPWSWEPVNDSSHAFAAHPKSITALSFSSDGSLLASGSSDNTICIWNLLDPGISTPLHVLEGHTGAIICLAFSSNNHQLVSGSYEFAVRIWDLQSSENLTRVLYGHTGWITSLAFSPDGEHIVSGSNDSSYRFWGSQTGRAVTPPIKPFDEWVSSINFSPDGMSIVACSIDGVMESTSIQMSETNQGSLYGHNSSVLGVVFSPDNKQLVSCSADQTIRVWDIQTGTESLCPLEGHTGSVRSVQFSPDGSLIASGSNDETVRIWDAVTGKQKGEPLRGHTDDINSVGFSPDGNHLVSGSDDCTVRVWNVETRSEAFKPLEGHTDWVWSVQYSPDGRYIVSGSRDMTVRLWDANTGKAVGEPFRGHDLPVTSVAFSPNGTRIVSCSDDHTIRIWDTKTGKAVGEPLRGHTSLVRSVAYSPDGKRIVSGSSDKTVRVWDVEKGKEVFEPLGGHTDWVRSVAWSPDGKLIASASDDKTIRLWDTNTGEPIRF